MKEINNNQIKEIVKLYTEDKISTKHIATKLKMSPTTVAKYLRKSNIRIQKARFKFNELYFENIDTSEKAYFLGLIYADGSINNKRNSCIIKLISTDDYILKELRTLIECTKPLYYSKEELIKGTNYIGKARSILNISSKLLVLTLEKLGLSPNKSQIIRFPSDEKVPTNLKWDFIRGYFDGDGCLSINKDNTLRVSIAGNKYFLEEMSEFINKSINYIPKITKHTRANCYYYKIDRLNKVLEFCNLIYFKKNCTKLIRKYKKYYDYINSKHYNKIKDYLKINGKTHGINKHSKNLN